MTILPSARIYVVEDDPDLAEIVADNLQREGYKVRIIPDGAQAYDTILKNPPNLIILDLNLPSLSGIELCRYLRKQPTTQSLPIIMLTARSEEIDKIIGFEVGADDYVTKPFSMRELMARVRALLKRTQKPTARIFEQGPLRVNFETYELWVENKPTSLTPIQFHLLKELIDARGKALSREYLLEAVWGEDYYGDLRTVDVHIARLRDRLGVAGKFIVTVKGVGYRWNFSTSSNQKIH